jgi:ketosteroid isomerase-like protein
MIFPDQWADTWVAAWNRRDLDALLALYAEDIGGDAA